MTGSLTKQTIAGAILAGGNASRMGGIPKGTIKDSKGTSIIDHLISEFEICGISPVIIVANDPHPYCKYGLPIIPDIRTGIGPIGGVESALVHLTGQCDAVMFVPCDMPNLTAKEMSTLKNAFIRSDALAVCAETADFFWHPLCAVVHNESAMQISSAMDCGQRKIQDIWKLLNVQRVYFEDETVFFNINSLSDNRQWRKENDEQKVAG